MVFCKNWSELSFSKLLEFSQIIFNSYWLIYRNYLNMAVSFLSVNLLMSIVFSGSTSFIMVGSLLSIHEESKIEYLTGIFSSFFSTLSIYLAIKDFCYSVKNYSLILYISNKFIISMSWFIIWRFDNKRYFV